MEMKGTFQLDKLAGCPEAHWVRAYFELNHLKQWISPEARFVRQIDRLEMALQDCLYEHQGETGLQEFFDSADLAVYDLRLRRIFDTLLNCRANNVAGSALE